jgi:hypothetical protein
MRCEEVCGLASGPLFDVDQNCQSCLVALYYGGDGPEGQNLQFIVNLRLRWDATAAGLARYLADALAIARDVAQHLCVRQLPLEAHYAGSWQRVFHRADRAVAAAAWRQRAATVRQHRSSAVPTAVKMMSAAIGPGCKPVAAAATNRRQPAIGSSVMGVVSIVIGS